MIKRLLTAGFIFLFATLLTAQDTVIVQTFTFDMITQRRGVFKFPDETKDYRKILMLKTLKCDPATTRDKYPCGEWDYLTYSTVYHPTGRIDSNAMEHPYFKLGWTAPDTVDYTSKATNSVYNSKYYVTTIESAENEESFDIGSGSNQISLGSDVKRMQFILASKDLKDMGLTKGAIQKISFNVLQPGDAMLRMSIRIKNAPAGQFTEFVNYGFDTLFYSDVQLNSTGLHEFVFNKEYTWSGFSGILLEVAYERLSGTAPVIAGWQTEKAIEASSIDNYLYFDGTNDAVLLQDKMNDFYGADKLTMEGWVRVDQWQAWNRLFGSTKTTVVLGGSSGQIYCIVRNPDNTHGNAASAISLDGWYHVAMVYDGTQATNEEKLKLYINGAQKSLNFTGTIPSTTDADYNPVSFSGIEAANQSLKGALDDIRIWKDAVPGNVIQEWYNKKLTNTHPNYSNLLAYYSFDNNTGTTADDEAAGNYPGTLVGCPQWMSETPMTMKAGISDMDNIPVMKFYRGDYTTKTETISEKTTIENPPISIIKYRVNGYTVEPFEIEYAWEAGWTFEYDGNGNKIDSTMNPKENTIVNHTLNYYGEPYEVLDPYEIGRYITPYGINLDLGPDGFTWVYDVTDYAPILKDMVDLASGNDQELLDLKFLFIKGTAPRDVVNINRFWGPRASYRYSDLSNDTKLSETEVSLHPDAKQFKMVTRLTGHGHNSNTGSYPHCCEWKDNTHSLLVNGSKVADWHIWQTNDCAENPVYPQGGTWPGSREGWCPGDVVKDNNFEITQYVTGNTVKIDYDITKVPTDNQGMGNGNYVVAMQLIEYGDFKFDDDAEIYRVTMPSKDTLFSRFNPVCSNPLVVVRNNGRNELTSAAFKYKVSGGKEETYYWNGSLASNEMMTVSLPIPGSEFWLGDGSNRFYVEVFMGNESPDEYPGNSSYVSDFNMPDHMPLGVVIEYRTNMRPQDYTYEIKDLNGNIVLSKSGLRQDRVYKDTLSLPEGCYTFEFTDRYNMGLSYWAYPEQGSGYIRFTDLDGKPLKTFNPDCGHGYNYSFNLGEITLVHDNDYNHFLQAFPNPAGEHVSINVSYEIGNAEITVLDLNGETIFSRNDFVSYGYELKIPTGELPAGIYFVRIKNADYEINQKFIKK